MRRPRPRNGSLVVERTWRAKTMATLSGRPMPMLSETRDSKEAPGPGGGSVEDQGAGNLDLAHGQLPPIAGVTVLRG